MSGMDSSDWSISFWCATSDLQAMKDFTAGIGNLISPPGVPEICNGPTTGLKPFDIFDLNQFANDVGAHPRTIYAFPQAEDSPWPPDDGFGFELSSGSSNFVTSEFTHFGIFAAGGLLGGSSVTQADVLYTAALYDISPTITGTNGFGEPTSVDYGQITYDAFFYASGSTPRGSTGSQAGPANVAGATPFYNMTTVTEMNSTSVVTVTALGWNRNDPADTTYNNFWSDVVLPLTTYTHVMMSVHNGVDLQVYFNDTEVLNETMGQEDAVNTHLGSPGSKPVPVAWLFPFSRTDYTDATGAVQAWTIAGRCPNYAGASTLPDGSGGDRFSSNNGLIINLVELWFAAGHYIDWSNSANRAKFHVKDGGGTIWAPCSLGAAGQTPLAAPPSLYCSGDSVSFTTNRANSTALTIYGTILPSSVPPPT